MRLVLTSAFVIAAAGLAAAQEGAVRRLLQQATVQLSSGCTGAVAELSQLVVTARHCVTDRRSVSVRLADGEERTGWVVVTDDASDQAVLFLEDPTDVTPLRLVRRRQIPGTVLYFAGNPDWWAFQSARIDRVGVCPSLPRLPNALFTTVRGRPGDSGAPLVDGAGDIVGLVHGGARCEIATPANTLRALIDEVLRPEPGIQRADSPGAPRRTGRVATGMQGGGRPCATAGRGGCASPRLDDPPGPRHGPADAGGATPFRPGG